MVHRCRPEMAERHCILLYNHDVPDSEADQKRPVLKQDSLQHCAEPGYYVPAVCIDSDVQKGLRADRNSPHVNPELCHMQ